MSHEHERIFHHAHADALDSAERRTWLPLEEVLARLDLAPGMNVADVGAGTGFFALPMAERVSNGGRVHAVDVQPEMLARIEQKLRPGAAIELVRGSAETTGLPASSEDLVFLAAVWHEIDDRARALVEAERVLKPAGRIAIVDWRMDVTPPPGPPTSHRLAEGDVAEQLRRSGWRDVAVRHVGVYCYLVTAHRPDRGAP